MLKSHGNVDELPLRITVADIWICDELDDKPACIGKKLMTPRLHVTSPQVPAKLM